MKRIETESSSDSKVVSQTPFERSLARRVAKARMVLELARVPASRANGQEMELIAELQGQLRQFELLNGTYIDTVGKYVAASLARKAMFKGEEDSIRHVAYVMKRAVVRDKLQDPVHTREIKMHYAAIFAQNPLAPPYDVVRPGFDKELDVFILSYSIILDHFRSMVQKIEAGEHIPVNIPYTIDDCKKMISRAETFGKEVASLIQKVYVVNDERLFVFERIKELCHAICNRSRFLFGSHDPVYKEINTLKYAIM
nr:hypothetical protein [uncultured Dyadobacter sp.]